MRSKILLLSWLGILLWGMSIAQDKIYKRNGSIITAKVLSIADNIVTFRFSDDADGRDHTLMKREISRIVYENGTTDVFQHDQRERPLPPFLSRNRTTEKAPLNSGKNIISFITGYTSSPTDQSINDVGVGVCYERRLDNYGHFSLNIPVMVFFSSEKDYNTPYYYNTSFGNYANYGTYTSYYFMPGVKFYPVPDKRIARYSLGASLFFIDGNEPYAVYDNAIYSTSPYAAPGDHRYAIYGAMITNSLNITATKHLFLGLDLTAGISFSDNRYVDNINYGMPDPILQVALKAGYRY